MELLTSSLVLLALISVGSYALKEAVDEESPYQVSIRSTDGRHLCGGVIIASKWVLSAKACLESYNTVRIAYGRAEAHNPVGVVDSFYMVFENNLQMGRRSSLALIFLQEPIRFSRRVKQAGLATSVSRLRNTTKLSGWKVMQGVPTLFINETYLVVQKNCMTPGGNPINLLVDEFCGINDVDTATVVNLGTSVTRWGVLHGLLTSTPAGGNHPHIFVNVQEHEDWIQSVMQSDADQVLWEGGGHTDSASDCVISFALMGTSAILLRLL